MGLLFYQAYAIVHLKVKKNKYMSPEHNTPQEPAPTEKMIAVPDWNAEQHAEKEDRFAVGNRVLVQRSDKTIEYNWTVKENLGDRILVTKVDKESGQVMEKLASRQALEALNDKYDEKLAMDLGGASLEAAGVGPVEDNVYDKLLFGDDSEINALSVEGAAVQPRFTEEEKLQRAREKADRDEWENNIYLQQKGLK